MKISISADSLLGVAPHIAGWVGERGHEVILRGALVPGGNAQWAWASAAAAQDVADGVADQAIVCCTTGTGAAIAANKVAGIRAALCGDAFTAAAARRWNDANALAISLRLTSMSQMQEMLDAWFAVRDDRSQAENIAHVNALDSSRRAP